MRHWVAITVALVAVGCSSEPVEPEDPWVDVGQGLEAFAPLDDGDEVEMVFGTQGRWHVDLASHFGGTTPDEHIAFYRVWDVDKRREVSYPVRMFVTPDVVVHRDDGSFQQIGVRSVFAIASADEVRDQEWLVEVELIVGPDVFVAERLIRVVDEEPGLREPRSGEP